MKHDDNGNSSQFEPNPQHDPKDGASETQERSSAPEKKSEYQILRKAKQHMGIIAITCAIVFLILYSLVNIESISSIFSAVLSVLLRFFWAEHWRICSILS